MNQRKKRGPGLDRRERLKNLEMERAIQNSQVLVLLILGWVCKSSW